MRLPRPAASQRQLAGLAEERQFRNRVTHLNNFSKTSGRFDDRLKVFYDNALNLFILVKFVESCKTFKQRF